VSAREQAIPFRALPIGTTPDDPVPAECECGEKAEDFEDVPAGWYWQSCFPGCLPDGDPIGPFPSKSEALAAAQEGQEE
jgi:hypothetical protein